MSSYKKYLFRLILVLVVILSIWFVMAALDAPSAIHFEENVTSVYDEGNFNLNWTAPTGDVANYSIYISVDGGTNFYIKALNDSTTGYSFSNITDANYTFQVAGVNATDAVEGANSTTYNMSVDTTAPIISLPVYTNATIKKNTEQLTLNISISDAKSGLTGSHCLIDVNGTNQTVTVSSGWCNSTVINLTGASDGNQTVKVYVNDTVNNFGLNNSFVVQVDTTAPTASASCSPTIVYSGSSFPCTCSGTDATSGVSTETGSSTSSDGTSTPTSTGTFTYTCTVTDNAGNSASATATYTVGRTSSDSGTTTPSLPKKINSWTQITPGVAAIMKDFDSEIGVKQIRVRVRNEVQNVGITVTKYSAKPAEVSVAKTGETYQYLQINAENFGEDLEQATVEFRAEISWAAGVELGRNDIAISRYNEAASRWDELTITSTGEDATYYYYEVELDEFSYFAISEKSVVSEEELVLGVEKSKLWLWILVAVAIIVIIVWWMKTKKE